MSTTDRVTRRVLPRHFVSARHGTQLRDAATGVTGWRPYGLQHARTVGSPTTACGLSAVEWPIFWELAFPRSPEKSCEECLAVVRFADQTEQARSRFADLAGGAR